MRYFEFKNEYINTLREFLALDKAEDNYPKMIFGPSSNDLANKLANLEESHPAWVEKIEDGLADNYLLQD
tara:strand:- start:391 stop:600 length:210 start_codon:yes stop_codon:yes gene_type:complete